MSLLVEIKKKFKGFYLDVKFETDGEYLGILGASGSGKSMTLKCIAGIETPDEGRIVLNDRVLFDSKKKINIKPQKRNIGYLFQNYALFPNMTVEENIGAGIKLSKKEKTQKIEELIKLIHLEGLKQKYPLQLSGGQQQRVALARMLAYEPDVLLLDEPFSALDTYLKEQIQTEILELLKIYSGEVLVVTHSRDEVYKFCKKLAIIDQGHTVLLGETKELFEQPKLLVAARLTHCKNISKCEVLSSNSIYAIDWDIVLETNKQVNQNCHYIGIHSHSFQIVNSKDEKNTITCKINKEIEEVFEYTIMFQNKNCKNDNSIIWYKVRKAEWDNRENRENLFLKIPEDAILLLE